ncbi:hypothetical protein AVEN_76896-1 [Araneus ventricosus]|uniref:Uncharacterized protein n=1 Tax=Araneus ventricosus TaxID=182803 RepID=A0A4Y2R2Y8_ARAVE|nr:hypothetical protein AVEN_76896-1 [Araneus ventricosus]
MQDTDFIGVKVLIRIGDRCGGQSNNNHTDNYALALLAKQPASNLRR